MIQTFYTASSGDDYPQNYQARFIGRKRELEWLDEHVLYRRERPVIVVHGPSGIGKSALLSHWCSQHSVLRPESLPWSTLAQASWFTASNGLAPEESISHFIEELYKERSIEPDWRDGRSMVVIDNAELLSEDQLEAAQSRLLNLKRIQSVVFISRTRPQMRRAHYLELVDFGLAEAQELLSVYLNQSLPAGELSDALDATKGNPLALATLAQLLRRSEGIGILELLKRPLYQASVQLILPDSKLIASIAPRIVSANEALIEKLRENPDELYELHPRRFEEVVAELFSGMGARVELTPATRDGGKDILVFWQTGPGEMLCLVDAKRYRRDRKVDLEMVKTLYGTLCDYQANSAMLVTTSSFTKDAQMLQKKHQYQLALKDYTHVVSWLQNHKRAID